MIFSVIVPYLNEERHIHRCIHSLRKQGFDKNEYEIIFIDNGSTDKSLDIVRSFPQIISLKEEKRSAYAARNRGLRIAKGQIIAFTDADREVSPDWLTEIYRGMTRTNAGIALGSCYFPSESSFALKFFQDYENAKTEYVLANLPKRYFLGYAGNMAVKAEIFKKIGPFCPLLNGGDVEFIQRYAFEDADSKVVYLPNAAIVHLEIATLRQWLKKINSYGRFIRLIESRPDSNYAPLDCKIRWRIYGYCARQNKYNFFKKTSALLLLALGNLCFDLGRWHFSR